MNRSRGATLIAAALAAIMILSIAPYTIGGETHPSEPVVPTKFIEDRETNYGHLGAFSQTLSTSGWPSMVRIGDLNNDSLADLAIACSLPDRIEIFYQDDTGVFSDSLKQVISLTGSPSGMDIGDIDGDGLNDIVLTLSSQGYVYFCYQNDSFAFNSLNSVTTFSDPRGVVTGDFDRDGRTDFAVATYNVIDGSYFLIHLAVRNYNYWYHELNPYGSILVTTMVAHDYNDDGKMDLILGAKGNDTVVVFRNDIVAPGGNTWNYVQTIDLDLDGPTDIKFYQVDSAGKDEMIVTCQDGGQVRIYRYDEGSSKFGTLWKNKVGLNGPVSSSMIDVNDDNTPDLVAITGGDNLVQYFNTTLGGSYPANPADRFPCHDSPILSETYDFDSDGLIDLMVACNATSTNGSVTIYYNQESSAPSNADGNAFFQSGTMISTVIGDFDSNGVGEIGSIMAGQDKMVFISSSSETLGTINLGTGPYSVLVSDLGGGDDLAIANWGSDNISLYWSESGFFNDSAASLEVPVNLSGPASIGSGDLNGDGLNDLIVGCLEGFEVLYNTGSSPRFDPMFSSTVNLAGGNFTRTTAGNFNIGTELSNGWSDAQDVAFLNDTANRVEIYFNQGDSEGFSPSQLKFLVPSGTGEIIWMASGLIDGDECSDIAVAREDGTVTIFFQDLSFAQGFDSSKKLVFSSPHGIIDAGLGDVDDDGLVEIALVGRSLGRLSVYEASLFAYTPVANLTCGAGQSTVTFGDVNRDLREDVLFSSPGSRSVSFVLQNNLPPSPLIEVRTPSPIYEGQEVSFFGGNSTDGLSDMDTLVYGWDFGDSTTTYGEQVYHNYLNDGPYNVTLRVTDRGDLFGETSIQIYVDDRGPMALFDCPASSLEGTSVQFNDLSSSFPDEIVKWEWKFGDGETATIEPGGDPSVTHTYLTDNPSYLVELTVTDDDGSTDSYTRTIEITDGSPTADFTVSDTGPIEGDEITFSSTSSSYPDVIVNWTWNFGDGQVGYGSPISHTFTNDGTFIVNLTVTDDDGSQDSKEATITVRDIGPEADFEFTSNSFREGDVVYFSDLSNSYDPIVNWTWDFGDGNSSYDKNPFHAYGDNGTFQVSLTVRDSDGSENSIVRNVMVDDTTPTIDLFYTALDLDSVDEDGTLQFRVDVTKGYEQKLRYEWDKDYNGTFNSTALSTDIGRITLKFTEEGTYIVAVRVADSDSYDIATLEIDVVNLAPWGIEISYYSIAGGNTRFVASYMDTESDIDTLQFSWDFGEGEGFESPGTNSNVTHHFDADGEYRVRVKVIDDDGASSIGSVTIQIDRVAPVIAISDVGGTAYVGKVTNVYFEVTDESEIASVILFYRLGEQANSLEMVRSGDQNIWVASIPGLNQTGTLELWVVANDVFDNSAQSGVISVQLVEDPIYIYAIAIVLVLAIVIIVLILLLRRSAIDDVFIIFEDGCLIAHETRRLKPGMDDEVLGSMLVAIQEFVRDSFKDEEETSLRGMDFGKKRILVERGSHIYVAAVLHGKGGKNTGQKLHHLINEIEDQYGHELDGWDGDLDRLRGVKEEARPILGLEPMWWSVMASKLKWSRASKRGEDVEGITCPVCNGSIDENARCCQNCGADLKLSDIDDLERIANHLSDEEPGDGERTN